MNDGNLWRLLELSVTRPPRIILLRWQLGDRAASGEELVNEFLRELALGRLVLRSIPW